MFGDLVGTSPLKPRKVEFTCYCYKEGDLDFEYCKYNVRTFKIAFGNTSYKAIQYFEV